MSKRRTRMDEQADIAAAPMQRLAPMNDKQAEYLRAMRDHEQVFVTGSSGTGKTYMAAAYAAELYAMGDVDKIIITRPNVSCGRDLGYLPGTLDEKYAPWAAPVVDVLRECLGHGKVQTDMKTTAHKPAKIEVAPLSLMRGRSFHDAFVLMDEAQNATSDEMLMFLTRLGSGTKAIINGDIRQKDLRGDSGLAYALARIHSGAVDVPHIEFGPDDIVRGGLVREWLLAW